MIAAADILIPDWPLPPQVRAASTTRRGGLSSAPYDSLNLGLNTDDAADAVASNHARLRQTLALPATPAWLQQVHGAEVIDLDRAPPGSADAAICSQNGRVLAVLTADCVPVLLCSGDGTRIGVAHAGWRGLLAGVIPACVAALGGAAAAITAWIGPAIGVAAYEVDDALAERFRAHCAENLDPVHRIDGRAHLDLLAVARSQLERSGVAAVYSADRCTASEAETFFSHRRDGPTGRQASLIWRVG